MKKLLQLLGPGLLYAGAAIGVSHLVQSTRAGADYGYSLVWAVLLANLLKYPFFEIGPRYAAATGKNLLHAYAKQGRFWLGLYLALTLSTMFIVLAAIAAVTAGLGITLFQLSISTAQAGALVLLFATAYLWFNGYEQLDKLVKIIVLVLSVATFFAFALSFSDSSVQEEAFRAFSWTQETDVLFLIALMGWMPAPIDISTWHSLWAVEKFKSSDRNPKNALLDFRIGFWGTAILALCFLSLGANVMFSQGIETEANSVLFSAQLVQLFTSNIGAWSYPIILVAAFTTMLSTTLTCLDAFPRALHVGSSLFTNQILRYNHYKNWLVFTGVGSSLVLFTLLTDMRSLVDLATVISFLIAPILAGMNYKAILSDEIPMALRYGFFMKALSIVGLAFLAGFSLFFLYTRFA